MCCAFERQDTLAGYSSALLSSPRSRITDSCCCYHRIAQSTDKSTDLVLSIDDYYRCLLEDDDHDDGDLRVSRASAVVQWQRGNRYICYRILNVPIRWVLYLFWRFFVSGISPPVRMTNNAYVIYRVVTFARACMFSIFTVNRALFRCFLSPHHAHSSIARPLSRKFVFQKLTSVFKSLCGALHSFFFAFRRFNGRRLLAD